MKNIKSITKKGGLILGLILISTSLVLGGLLAIRAWAGVVREAMEKAKEMMKDE